MIRRMTIFIFVAAVCVFSGFSEGEVSDPAADAGFGFQAAVSLGADAIPVNGAVETWNKLGFQPDISFGKFGIGFDLSVRFKFYPDPDTAIELYPGDWLPDYEGSGYSVFDLYMAKIMYIRYGKQGDPLYVKLGSIDNLTLGDGFIVGGYANTRYLPALRFFGLQAGVDGALFDFPYLGLDVLTGNLAQLDVIGGRFFVRPLYGSELPVIKNLQTGLTLVADTKPDLYNDTDPANDADPVMVYGLDVFLPLMGGDLFPLGLFTDFAMEPKNRWGWMAGAAGRLVGVITYGAQVRVLGAGFIPDYFDANYDLFRSIRYDAMQESVSGGATAGWAANLGLSVLKDAVSFGVALDGPFQVIPSVKSANSAEYPHVRGVANLAQGIIGGFSFDAAYDKYFLGSDKGFFRDLLTPEDAVISAAINYHTGAAVISLVYNLKYNPEADNGFDVSSSIQSTVQF
ncbi:MAG: hypothetical protein NT080_12405 [Spirochaetes bacterium]|nr:hypothetical protein [Spirochaetota bacterium]